MRSARAVSAALVLLACLAAPARAQTGEEPNLIFSISGGILAGGNLWTLPRQLVFSDQTGAGDQWDTMALGRKLHSGFDAALTATYFWKPHLGLTVEAGFFGLESESACTPVGAITPTPQNNNQNAQACATANGLNLPGSVAGFLAGVTYRVTTRGVQPYVRAGIGPAILGTSFVETTGQAIVSNTTEATVYMLADEHHRELTYMASVGVGLMLPLAPGYQVRMEFRDIFIALPRPTGPATDTAQIANEGAYPDPPIGTRLVSVANFTVGLDVVLEKRRGHRY